MCLYWCSFFKNWLVIFLVVANANEFTSRNHSRRFNFKLFSSIILTESVPAWLPPSRPSSFWYLSVSWWSMSWRGSISFRSFSSAVSILPQIFSRATFAWQSPSLPFFGQSDTCCLVSIRAFSSILDFCVLFSHAAKPYPIPFSPIPWWLLPSIGFWLLSIPIYIYWNGKIYRCSSWFASG